MNTHCINSKLFNKLSIRMIISMSDFLELRGLGSSIISKQGSEGSILIGFGDCGSSVVVGFHTSKYTAARFIVIETSETIEAIVGIGLVG